MAGSVQHDFFGEEKKPIFQRRRSFRDIQGVISKMNPEVVKSVIANETPKKVPIFPVCDPTLRLSCGHEKKAETETAPMTIFYNGMVAVFDMPAHKAKNVLEAAQEMHQKKPEQPLESSRSSGKESFLQSFSEDLPITRKNSLQRFLEKRKERLTVLSPYYFPT